MRRRIIALLSAGALSLSALVALAPPSVATGTGSITGTISPAGAPNLVITVCTMVGGKLGDCSTGATVDSATGAYSITGLGVGDYVVSAVADGYLTTWYGGYSYPDVPWNDVSGKGIITVTDAGTATADIALVQGATVTGVLSPAGAPNAWVSVCVVDPTSVINPYLVCMSTRLNADGTFSATVPAGSTVISLAKADGYLETYLGGCVWSFATSCDADSPDVTRLTAPVAGQTLAIGTITLARAATISGTITPAAAIPANAYVEMCSLNTDDPASPSTQGCSGGNVEADGTYRFTDLQPGAKYVVYAGADGYLQTWRGGGTGLSPDLADPAQVTVMQAPAAGGTLAGQDIALQQGATITGTITPTLPYDATAPAYAQITYCQVITATDGSRSVGDCSYTSAPSQAGNPPMTYTITVAPNSTVVIDAWTDGYLPTYRGGYADTRAVTTLPVTGVTEIAAPGPGQTLAGQDIAMVKAATLTGKVTLPAGYSLDPSGWNPVVVYEVDPSSGDPVLANSTVGGPIQPDGTYTATGLVPGRAYVVCASYLNTLPRADLLTTCHGGYATTYTYLDGTPTHPGMTPVTAPATGVDITVVQPLTITGTVYMPDGVTPFTPDPSAYAGVMVSIRGADGYTQYVEGASLNDDGTYSVAVVPGDTYYIVAAVTGYPNVWRGGYLGQNPALPNPQVTPVTGTAGQTIAGQNITLVAGSAITGTLSYSPVDPGGNYPDVMACRITAAGDLQDCQIAQLTGPGPYRLDGVIPGVPYVVFAQADGFSYTFYGGLVGFPKLPHAGATQVTTAAPGGVLPNINITLSQKVMVTGTVFPPAAAATGVTLWVCPVYADGGQNYYVDQKGPYKMAGAATATATATDPATNGPGDVGASCILGTADPATGMWATLVDAGQQYVIVAQAAGYTDAWYGGFVGASALIPYDPRSPLGALLPVTDQIRLVSGTAGSTVAGLNITFGAAVLVTFDAAGGTPGTQVRSVAPGAVTVLPAAPTRNGYVFAGWYTGKDGAGTQFTAATPVTAAVTVYAKWTPSIVSPGGGTSIPPSSGAAAIALFAALAVAVVIGAIPVVKRHGLPWPKRADSHDPGE